MVPPIRDARFVDLILAVFMCNSARRQERVCRAQRPGAQGSLISDALSPFGLGRILRFPRRLIMKLVLIAVGLLVTTGVVYAACIFC
jgi:hypothetical protein